MENNRNGNANHNDVSFYQERLHVSALFLQMNLMIYSRTNFIFASLRLIVCFVLGFQSISFLQDLFCSLELGIQVSNNLCLESTTGNEENIIKHRRDEFNLNLCFV